MALKIRVPTNLKGKLWELKESISQPDGFLSTSIENYSIENSSIPCMYNLSDSLKAPETLPRKPQMTTQ